MKEEEDRKKLQTETAVVRERKTRCRTWIKEGVSVQQEMDKMEQINCVGNEKRRGNIQHDYETTS